MKTILDEILEAEFNYFSKYQHKARMILLSPSMRDQMEVEANLYSIMPRNQVKMKPEKFMNLEIIVVSSFSHDKNYMEVVG